MEMSLTAQLSRLLKISLKKKCRNYIQEVQALESPCLVKVKEVIFPMCTKINNQRNLVFREKQKLRENSQCKEYEANRENERQQERATERGRERQNSCLTPNPLCLFPAAVSTNATYISHEMLLNPFNKPPTCDRSECIFFPCN